VLFTIFIKLIFK